MSLYFDNLNNPLSHYPTTELYKSALNTAGHEGTYSIYKYH
jgi:hypothetical protein